jgi:methylmalonyl-CoA mutase
MGSEYLTQLTGRGLSADIAASKIRFSFGIGSNYLSEIAKLRAARLLWSVITNGFQPADRESIKMDIHCVTSEWNKTVQDPYVNLLRTQTEAMSAILGGADSLTVEPFDITFRKPDEFSERIARNQQLILKEESYFDKVADPAAGSYYIEYLTYLIAENTWKLFLEIEEKGGFLSSQKSGLIQKKLSESAAKRKNIKDYETKVQI